MDSMFDIGPPQVSMSQQQQHVSRQSSIVPPLPSPGKFAHTFKATFYPFCRIIVLNDQAKLNHFFQRHNMKSKYAYDEDHSTGLPRFKCTIIFLWNGRTVRPDSGGFHSRKDDAKERASSKALLIVGTGIQSRGGNSEAITNNVSWKSRLKEFYDKRGQPDLLLCYKTEEVAGNNFVSSIFIPELGREVKGGLGRSKKDAEQDAARQSLELLSRLPIVL